MATYRHLANQKMATRTGRNQQETTSSSDKARTSNDKTIKSKKKMSAITQRSWRLSITFKSQQLENKTEREREREREIESVDGRQPASTTSLGQLGQRCAPVAYGPLRAACDWLELS